MASKRKNKSDSRQASDSAPGSGDRSAIRADAIMAGDDAATPLHKLLSIALPIVCLLVGFGFGYYRQSPGFSDPYVCNDDARQQVYWMARFHDDTLFQNDVVVDYAAQYVTPGVKAIYWLLTFVWTPIMAGKWLACALMGIGAFYCARIGSKLVGPSGALSCGLLFAMLIPIADRIVGGNPRAFMYPLLAAWLCYLVHGRQIRLAVVAVISAATYPMAFVLMAPVWLLNMVRFERFVPRIDTDKQRWITLATGLVLGGAILGGKYIVGGDERFGEIADRQRVMSDPAFADGGRFAEVRGDGTPSLGSDLLKSAGTIFGLRGRWDGESWERSNPAWSGYATIGVVLLWIILATLRLMPLPRSFVYLALSSLLVYSLAWLVIFRLFVPSRYLQFSLALLVLLGVALLIATAVQRLARWIPATANVRTWTAAATATLLMLLAGTLLNTIRKPVPQIELAKAKALWDGIAKVVPPDAVVAGVPDEIDSIGALCGRKAYMPNELAHPAYVGYYDDIVLPRLKRTFDAIYAENPEDIVAFAREEGVDYLLVNITSLSQNKVDYKYEPTHSHIVTLQRNKRPRCLLKNIRRDRVLVTFGGYRLIKISPGPDNAFGIDR